MAQKAVRCPFRQQTHGRGRGTEGEDLAELGLVPNPTLSISVELDSLTRVA